MKTLSTPPIFFAQIFFSAVDPRQHNYTMQEYYVLNRDPCCADLFKFIQRHELSHEVHLNRTRFWVPDGPIYTEFALRWAQNCPLVESS